MPYLTEKKVPNIGSYSADALDNPQKYPYGFTVVPVALQIALVQVRLGLAQFSPSKVGLILEKTANGDAYEAGFLNCSS